MRAHCSPLTAPDIQIKHRPALAAYAQNEPDWWQTCTMSAADSVQGRQREAEEEYVKLVRHVPPRRPTPTPTPQPAPMPKEGPSLPRASDLTTGRPHLEDPLLPPKAMSPSLACPVRAPEVQESSRISLSDRGLGGGGEGTETRVTGPSGRTSPPDQPRDPCTHRVYATVSEVCASVQHLP
jgi:hypothetical protein